LRVLERRLSSSAHSNQIQIDFVWIDTKAMQMKINDVLVELSKSEFILLKALMQNAGRVLTRDSLEAKLYAWGDEVSSNTLEVHIHHLRKKIKSPFIKTIRGVGYTVNQK
jgi:two-component system OmpR family response regulator/two-component system response regulator QseB